MVSALVSEVGKNRKKVSNFLSQCKMKINYEKFHVFLMEDSVFIFIFIGQVCLKS